MADAAHAERSKLIQKQKQQRQELEKKVKKLKGAMKQAAQEELEELDGKHETELAKFDRDKGVAVAEPAGEKKEAAEASSSSAAAAGQDFRERNWSGLSKKELEEACVDRGLGKKGSKEDLIQKLIIFQQEHKASAPPPGAGKKDDSDASSSEEEDEEEEEDEDEDDEEDDDEEAVEVSAEEMEKQGKREQVVRKAIRHLLASDKGKEGFPLSELADRLAAINVAGFAPEKLGYKTTEKFVKGQPNVVLKYDRKKQMILPPK